VDWGVLASTAVGGAIAIAGSGILVRWQDRLRRREEAARIAGAALAALRELNPEVWGERIALQSPAESARITTAAKRTRWLDAVGGLYVLVALYPTSRVADLARTIIARGDLVSIRLNEVADGARITEAWEKAIPEHYHEGVGAAEELVREVHRADALTLRRRLKTFRR
jgi:hypothetical protein